jgi:radical SAM family uncharacterized protein/radical SAM-linked protein
MDPLAALGPRLLEVAKPARYLGGELGAIAPASDYRGFLFALCFPDLYEIGMSNNAIRILYSELNRLKDLRCERVFAPAPDFEALLASLDLPLYTLESGYALRDADMLGFSLGYELAATSILSVLKSGRIALERKDRAEDEPIVIMGGPAISNPHPFARFMDACYIGEAEAGFFELSEKLAERKKAGCSRNDLLDEMATSGAFWFPKDSPFRKAAGRPSATGDSDREAPPFVARRAVSASFGTTAYHTSKPIATLKPVQDHGTVEIMRGCPNGCRFCHAGYYYRPQRVKDFDSIEREVEELVLEGGYREITLASLSSGDYPGIADLLDALNAKWNARGVSFQLPSLKVSSFNLPLIEKISEVRKSGLTFAVETPMDAWQRVINKDVSFEQTVNILEAAKERGFKLAKFYFMIGLPVPGGSEAEADAIIDFFERLYARVRIQLNVNVGTFVPKPHTPFQWLAQIGEDEALAAIHRMKDGLRKIGSIKVSYHSPFVSLLEGIISRGDERVGELMLEAFNRGARLEAWDEHFDRELWRSVIEGAGWDVKAAYLSAHDEKEAFVWEDVSIGVGKAYLRRELERARRGEFTSRCEENCTNPCGACTDSLGVVQKTANPRVEPSTTELSGHCQGRLVFEFEKRGGAAYLPHLAIVEALSRAFSITGLPALFSMGFNPMPRLELVQPLPIGVESEGEVGTVLLSRALREEASLGTWIERLNAALPDGLRIRRAAEFAIHEGKKIHSLNGLSWGSVFEVVLPPGTDREALAASLKARLEELAIEGFSLERNEKTIAVAIPDSTRKDTSFFRILESVLPHGEGQLIQSLLPIRRISCLSRPVQGQSLPSPFIASFSALAEQGAL